jgi:hypothetical protein
VKARRILTEKLLSSQLTKGNKEVPQINPDSDSCHEAGENVFSAFDENDPAVISAQAAWQEWAAEYFPLKFVWDGLKEMPTGWDELSVWSSVNYWAAEYLENGFVPFDDENPGEYSVRGYVITERPCNQEARSVWVTTVLVRDCQRCDSSGETMSGTCPDCDGRGTRFFEVEGTYPDQEVVPGVGSVAPVNAGEKFCSECGTQRKTVSSKFCSNCGGAF